MFWTGFVIGLAFAAPPGAVNAEALRRGLAGGVRPAFSVEAGSLVGDTLWAIAGLTGTAALSRVPVVRTLLGLAGCVLLVALAVRLMVVARRPLVDTSKREGHAFLTGVAISIANPWGGAFWLGIGGAVAGAGRAPGPVFLLGYLLGCSAWAVGFSAVVGWAGRFITPRLYRAICLICAVALAWFGVRLGISIVT